MNRDKNTQLEMAHHLFAIMDVAYKAGVELRKKHALGEEDGCMWVNEACGPIMAMCEADMSLGCIKAHEELAAYRE